PAAEEQQPDVAAGKPLKPFHVQIVDAAGNVVDDGPDSTVTVRLAINEDGAHPKATFLTDLNTQQQLLYVDRPATAGVATYAGGADKGVAIKLVGTNYFLVAATQSFFAAPFTSHFGVNVLVGPPAQLVYSLQPGTSGLMTCLQGPPVVNVLDSAG